MKEQRATVYFSCQYYVTLGLDNYSPDGDSHHQSQKRGYGEAFGSGGGQVGGEGPALGGVPGGAPGEGPASSLQGLEKTLNELLAYVKKQQQTDEPVPGQTQVSTVFSRILNLADFYPILFSPVSENVYIGNKKNPTFSSCIQSEETKKSFDL